MNRVIWEITTTDSRLQTFLNKFTSGLNQNYHDNQVESILEQTEHGCIYFFKSEEIYFQYMKINDFYLDLIEKFPEDYEKIRKESESIFNKNHNSSVPDFPFIFQMRVLEPKEDTRGDIFTLFSEYFKSMHPDITARTLEQMLIVTFPNKESIIAYMTFIYFSIEIGYRERAIVKNRT